MIMPTLMKDDILRTSSAPNECFVILDDELGHQEPIRLRPEYAIEKADFEALKPSTSKLFTTTSTRRGT